MFRLATLDGSLDTFHTELQVLQARLQQAVQNLSLAKQLLQASTHVPTPSAKYDYIPVSLPHSYDSVLRHEFGLDSSGFRLWCMFQSPAEGTHWLGDQSAVRQHLLSAQSSKPPLWPRISHRVTPQGPRVPPMWARRFVILKLGCVCVWSHPRHFVSAHHIAVNNQWSDTSSCDSPNAIDYVPSDVAGFAPDGPQQWIWSENPETPDVSFKPVVCARYAGTVWHLHASCAAIEATSLLQSLRLHAHFKHQDKGHGTLWKPSEYQQLLCNTYTKAIHKADIDSDLGGWAELLEYRLQHLPYHRNPLLWTIRACLHFHELSISAPAHGHIIYVVFHTHLFCLYFGKTEDPLMKCLRKHWTTARSGAEDSPFYSMLCRTGIHHWSIAPLQWTNCSVTACFLERSWWFKWKKWALNACALAIPSPHDQHSPAPQHTKRLGTVLRRLHTARIELDYA